MGWPMTPERWPWELRVGSQTSNVCLACPLVFFNFPGFTNRRCVWCCWASLNRGTLGCLPSRVCYNTAILRFVACSSSRCFCSQTVLRFWCSLYPPATATWQTLIQLQSQQLPIQWNCHLSCSQDLRLSLLRCKSSIHRDNHRVVQ